MGITTAYSVLPAYWRGLNGISVIDVYLFCTDGLCGMMQAIEAVFPNSRLQRCVVHQIRASTRFVSYKDISYLISLYTSDWISAVVISTN